MNKLVPRDRVAAWSWALLASGHGNKEAKWLLKEMETFVSPEVIVQGRKRAAEFQPSMPK